MGNVIFLLVGAWLGYELKRILDKPYDIPETTRQYLANQEPKCKWCLVDDCDTQPEPGSYSCKEHLKQEA